METIAVSKLPELVGKEFAPTAWLEITQERVNQFADATNDHQFIHVDAEKASQTPLGGTIAHGYLTLSLLSHFSLESGVLPEGVSMVVNYGSDKVRYLTPVRVGSRVRAHMKIIDVTEKNPGQWLIKTGVSIEIEGVEKPALVAEILGLFFVK